MPVYRRCLNQDCGWKNSCREFFTLEEFKGPSIIPPSVKCACGCFRAQHERVDDKDPQSRDSMPSAAPPSATQGSTLPHSSPLHPFINKFVPAANAAAAAATERLDGFNQHRVQTAAFNLATTTAPAFQQSRRGRKPKAESNSILNITILFIRDTSAIDAWALYDADDPSTEPYERLCPEPSDTNYSNLLQQGLVSTMSINQTWSDHVLREQLRFVIEGTETVSRYLSHLGQSWSQMRVCLPMSRGVRKTPAMVAVLDVMTVSIAAILRYIRKRNLNGQALKVLYLCLPQGGGLLSKQIPHDVSTNANTTSSTPDDSEQTPLFGDDEMVFDSPNTLFQKSLPRKSTNKPVEGNDSHQHLSKHKPEEYQWPMPHWDVLERITLFFNPEAGPPLNMEEVEGYKSLRDGCSEADIMVSADVLREELGMGTPQPDADTAVSTLFTAIQAALKTIGLCETSALPFNCGPAAFGSFIDLGVTLNKWFPLGILSPPVAKTLSIQLEDLYRRVAIQVSMLKRSLERVGCDPPEFRELLDSLIKNESHFPVAETRDQFPILGSLQDISCVNAKDVQSLLISFFGSFEDPSGIQPESLLLGAHGLYGFYHEVIGPFLDHHPVSTPEFSHKRTVLSLLCQSLKARLEAEAILFPNRKKRREYNPQFFHISSDDEQNNNHQHNSGASHSKRRPSAQTHQPSAQAQEPKRPQTPPHHHGTSSNQSPSPVHKRTRNFRPPPTAAAREETPSEKRLRLFASMAESRFYQVLEREYPVNREASRLSVTRDKLMNMGTEKQRVKALRLVYHTDKLQNQGYTEEQLEKFHDVILEINRRASLL